MNSIGFDVGKKSPHVWNFYNDVEICAVCKLIYSCVQLDLRMFTITGFSSMIRWILTRYMRLIKKLEMRFCIIMGKF
ncbi:Cas8a1 family CRISPR/Cas system-associated protein [Listeria rocourtiae]|uniref:Cas8a1 family CRISPR/Cas system-associated protein n=1 Tax=Listeria rocourtiae TaxID=647910 RepID=UPI00289337C8|nr:Cas8a1 family CRISPR/Cas system-associated protein [Listeria rocourtiae]